MKRKNVSKLTAIILALGIANNIVTPNIVYAQETEQVTQTNPQVLSVNQDNNYIKVNPNQLCELEVGE